MAIVLLATISHAGSFNFFKENSAISEQSLSEDKSIITEDQEYADLGCQVSKGGIQNYIFFFGQKSTKEIIVFFK